MRKSELHPADLAAYRLLGAAILLSPLFFMARKRHTAEFRPSLLLCCIVPGIVLGLHFLIWVQGSRMTPATNAILAVNTGPIILPFLLFFLAGEKVNRREVFGTLIALAGLCVLAFTDFDADPGHFYGDMVCLAAMVMLALYMALARRYSGRFANNWLYAVPVYYIASASCVLVRLISGNVPEMPGGIEWLWVFCLVFFPTIFGHGLLLFALRHLRGQLVGVCSLCQFVSAGVFAYFAFGEIPSAGFMIAAAFVIAGAVVVITAKRDEEEVRDLEMDVSD